MNAERRTGFRQVSRWVATLALIVGYPVISHMAATSASPDFRNVLVAVAPLTVLAFTMAWRSSHPKALLLLCIAMCGVLYSASAWLLMNYRWVFLLEHAGVYALLCVAFGRTLQAGNTPMLTGFARIVHGELSPALMRYTRSATWAWTLYFGSISGLSLLLFWLSPIAIWSAFANLLGGPLLVLMFVGEYAARCYVLPVADRAGPLEAIRAYRQASSHRTVRQP